MSKPLILVVEDDTAVSNLICTTLEMQSYQYNAVKNGSDAIR